MALPVALAVSLHYGCSLLWPAVLACSALFVVPGYALAILALGTLGWAAYLVLDGAEFREGRPDPAYSRDAWLLRTMRAYLRLQLHRAEQVEIKLLEQAQKDAAPQVRAGRGKREGAQRGAERIPLPSRRRQSMPPSRTASTRTSAPAWTPCSRMPFRALRRRGPWPRPCSSGYQPCAGCA
eukprot:scaffold124415_cov33-Tisochrysis_lutea.AAC.1